MIVTDIINSVIHVDNAYPNPEIYTDKVVCGLIIRTWDNALYRVYNLDSGSSLTDGYMDDPIKVYRLTSGQVSGIPVYYNGVLHFISDALYNEHLAPQVSSKYRMCYNQLTPHLIEVESRKDI